MKKIVRFSDCKHEGLPGNELTHKGPWPGNVFLDGQDVTHICWRWEIYDDGTAKAFIYLRDVGGGYLMNGDKSDIVTGEIEGKTLELVP